MDHAQNDIAKTSTCTSCMPTEDFSNYWTAVLFFRYDVAPLFLI